MIPPATPVPSGCPDIRLLPQEEAHDFEYWARRLVNPGLLRDAVAIALLRVPLLAVLVGEGRLFGELHLHHEHFTEQAVAALHGRAGFPRLAAQGSLLVWGDRPPVPVNRLARLQLDGLRAPDGVTGDNHPPRLPTGGGSRGLEKEGGPSGFEQCRNGAALDTAPGVTAAPIP